MRQDQPARGRATDASAPTQYTPIIPGQDLDYPVPDEPVSLAAPGRRPGASEHSGQGGQAAVNEQGHQRSEPDRDPNPPSSTPGAPLSRKEVHRWAAGAHLGGVLAWIPVAPIIPAAAIYAVYKDRSPYLKEQALEAINFQICVFLLWILASLIDRLPIIYGFTFLVWLFSAFFAIIGALAALRGRHFSYPLSRQFLHAGNSHRWGGGPGNHR